MTEQGVVEQATASIVGDRESLRKAITLLFDIVDVDCLSSPKSVRAVTAEIRSFLRKHGVPFERVQRTARS